MLFRLELAVFNMSKIQIWKRITTADRLVSINNWLYLICQRYKFESESQLIRSPNHIINAVFNMSKIQIWKRITTVAGLENENNELYLICQRYKFESESQQTLSCAALKNAVFNMSKIQIWKRITTWLSLYQSEKALYLICQRYKFESESQHYGCLGEGDCGCI